MKGSKCSQNQKKEQPAVQGKEDRTKAQYFCYPVTQENQKQGGQKSKNSILLFLSLLQPPVEPVAAKSADSQNKCLDDIRKRKLIAGVQNSPVQNQIQTQEKKTEPEQVVQSGEKMLLQGRAG